jgi:hypothetical protein
MFAPPSSPPPAFDGTRLDDRDKEALTMALAATSDWLVGVARILLLAPDDPVTGQR